MADVTVPRAVPRRHRPARAGGVLGGGAAPHASTTDEHAAELRGADRPTRRLAHLGRPRARAADRQDPRAPRPAACPRPTPAPLVALGATVVREPRRRHPLVGARGPRGQHLLRHAARTAGVERGGRGADAVRARRRLRRPRGARRLVGGTVRASTVGSRDGQAVALARGRAGLPVHVLGVRARARAEDGEEPAALGRRPDRRRPVGARRGRRDACSASRTPDDEWWVLADPEGNEFCAFPPTV